MAIKRILLPLPGAGDHSSEMDTALSAAKALDAYVEALFISEPPSPAVIRSGDLGYGRMAAAQQVTWVAEQREKLAQEARDRFVTACASSGVPVRGTSEERGTLPAAAWRAAEGTYVSVAVLRAAAFDLIVAASAAVMAPLSDIAEQSLLQQRRPVLLAPSRFTSSWTSTAMIAWDESTECWHAVTAALPFLRLAQSVQVVSVDRHADRRTASQAEAVAYLRCHGIEAMPRVIAPDSRSVGDTLLAAAEESEVGLLIMGAYSHSRLREMLLGGVTRHILKEAAARPVLLAH